MLVLGTNKHFQDIKRMVLEFFDNTPYKPLGIDEARIEQIIDTFLKAELRDKIILLWIEDNHPVGMLAAAAETNVFNFSKMAYEFAWWVDPDYRTPKIANNMIKAYERWARNAGCQLAVLVDLLGNLDKYYERKGYVRRETAYSKVL